VRLPVILETHFYIQVEVISLDNKNLKRFVIIGTLLMFVFLSIGCTSEQKERSDAGLAVSTPTPYPAARNTCTNSSKTNSGAYAN
jgi:hypothetical protein